MRENRERLMLMGFGIILMSFMILSNVQAQSSLHPNSRYPSTTTIQSKDDYLKVEKLVDNLAGELFRINQVYPEFTYHHHYNDNQELISVTVYGIDNFAVADKVALYIMNLEKLGSEANDVNDAYLPELPELKKEDILNEKQAAEYVPDMNSIQNQ